MITNNKSLDYRLLTTLKTLYHITRILGNWHDEISFPEEKILFVIDKLIQTLTWQQFKFNNFVKYSYNVSYSFLFTSLSDTPDIKSHDIINGACFGESKQTNKKADSNIPIQEGNHNQVLSDYRILKTSKPKIVSVSIESLIESENVSYIDEEIDKESIKRVDIDEDFQIKIEKTDFQVGIE